MRYVTTFVGVFLIALAIAGCQPEDDQSANGSSGGSSSLKITTTTLPNCGFATDYLETLAASGGTAPYKWELVSGALPGNIEVSIAGDVVGHPSTTTGPFNFRVRVTDQLAATAEADFVLTVDQPASPYYGEPVLGEHLFVIDASAEAATKDTGKMLTRLERSVQAVATMLAQFNQHDRFEIMAYGPGGISRCFGSLQYRTPGTASMAAYFLTALAPGGNAEMYGALKSASLDYGSTLTKVYLFAGAEPGADPAAPGGVGSYNAVLADFPGWWTYQTDAELVCENVIPTGTIAGTTSPSGFSGFIQSLAALAGGTYSLLP